MLREFAEVVDALTAETPLLLVLEDLHWSDYATLDLLALLARRRIPARLLVLGTYRPVETIVHQHPLRTVVQDLQRHGHALDLPLALLSAEAVATYLAARFPRAAVPGGAGAVAAPAHRRPSVVSGHFGAGAGGAGCAARARWVLERAGGLAALALQVPESLRQLLEQQFAHGCPQRPSGCWRWRV